MKKYHFTVLICIIILKNGFSQVEVHLNGDSIVATANKYLGAAYKYGGKDQNGFDCSGFVGFIYSKYGVSLPSNSRDMALEGIEVSLDQTKIGDLIFFKGNDKMGLVGHVGIVVSNLSKIKWIHASTSHGVRYDTFDNKYFKERFVSVRRIIN